MAQRALTRRAVVLAKVQTAQGVDALPSPSLDAVMVSDMRFAVNGSLIERQFLRDALSRVPTEMGPTFFEAQFTLEFKSGPALGARPEWSALMRAGGLQETVNATITSIRTAALRWTLSGAGSYTYYVELAAGGNPTLVNPGVVREGGQDMNLGPIAALKPGQFAYGNQDALGFNTVYIRLTDGADPDIKALAYVEHVAGANTVYDLRDGGHEYATVCIYPDGLEIRAVDSIIDWEFACQAGETAKLIANLQSKYATPTDAEVPAPVNYQSHMPPICENVGFTIDGFSGGVPVALSVSSGTEITPRYDLNFGGLKTLQYGGRSVEGSLTIEQELASSFNFFQKFDQSTEMAVSAALGTAGQRISMSAPNTQFGSLKSADLKGLRGLTVPLFFNEDQATARKEFRITLD